MPQPAPAPRSIAVLRALWLGDLLCAVPVFRALRTAWPHARIALVGLPWAHEFVERFDAYLDELIVMPGLPGLAEQQPDHEAVDGFLDRMRARRFDLAIQLQGDGRVSNAFVAEWGARRLAGFHWPGYLAPDPETFVPYRDEGREVTRLLRILPALGVPSTGERLEFPLRPDDARELAALREADVLAPGRYAIVHPGSRDIERQWAPEAFAMVADALARVGLRVVVTGSQAEGRLAGEIRRHATRADLVDVTGQTSLGALGALVDAAAVVVCNDTGISHVADALGTPSVVVSLDGETVRFAPADGRLHPFVDIAAGATVDDVIRTVLDLVRVAGARVA